MIDQKNIETLFDCLDESATLLYKTYKTSYIDGLIITCENIMSNSIDEEHLEIKSELEVMLQKVTSIEFEKEEIRKAFQYACLRGFKHANISNQMITPDTLGIFINYLISKLYIKKDLLIMDPLVGTGNLITSIANNAEGQVSLIGIEIEEVMYKLASALFDMLDYGDSVFCQDTMTYKGPQADCIIVDFSEIEEKEVYEIIKYHSQNIRDGGFLIGIFNLETVQPEILVKHAQKLNELWKLFGMINLPQVLARNQMKSIVLFQRNGSQVIQPEKFLLVDLPDFNEKEEMLKIIDSMNKWFKNTEFYKL